MTTVHSEQAEMLVGTQAARHPGSHLWEGYLVCLQGVQLFKEEIVLSFDAKWGH